MTRKPQPAGDECLQYSNSCSYLKASFYNIYAFYYRFKNLANKVWKPWRKLFNKLYLKCNPSIAVFASLSCKNMKAKCYLFWRNTEQDKLFDVTRSCFACQPKQFSPLFTALCILKNVSEVSWTLLCLVIVCYWENKTATIICSTNGTCQLAGTQSWCRWPAQESCQTEGLK